MNDVPIGLQDILPGEFLFCPQQSTERTLVQRSASLASSFRIGITPVTQGQWAEVMGTRPWRTERCFHSSKWEADADRTTADLPMFSEDDECPAVGISWHDATEFCAALSQQFQRRFRLPTHLEWQYCYRAGTDTHFYWGDLDQGRSVADNFGWYRRNSGGKLPLVSGKPANPWGLFDMAGTVAEWVFDSARMSPDGPYFASDHFPSDLEGFVSLCGPFRVAVNDSFKASPFGMVAASCDLLVPAYRGFNVGFRVVEELTR